MSLNDISLSVLNSDFILKSWITTLCLCDALFPVIKEKLNLLGIQHTINIWSFAATPVVYRNQEVKTANVNTLYEWLLQFTDYPIVTRFYVVVYFMYKFWGRQDWTQHVTIDWKLRLLTKMVVSKRDPRRAFMCTQLNHPPQSQIVFVFFFIRYNSSFIQISK